MRNFYTKQQVEFLLRTIYCESLFCLFYKNRGFLLKSETPETGVQSKYEGITSKRVDLKYDSTQEPVHLFYQHRIL